MTENVAPTPRPPEESFEPSAATVDAWEAQAHMLAYRDSPHGSTKAKIEKELAGEAFECVVAHTQDELFRGLMARCNKDSHAADEILQETYIRAYKSLPSFRGDGQVESWLWKIMLSRLSDYYAKQAKQKARHVTQTGPYEMTEIIDALPAEEVELWDGHREEVAKRVHEALEQLSPSLGRAVVAFYMRGLSHDQVGQELGISEGLSRVRVHRALEKLRQIPGLKKLRDDEV
jgi:RNA polymerase sigma-70 factor (ECF subfamily)